jgi:hypothetical protein
MLHRNYWIQFLPIIGVLLILVFYPNVYWGDYDDRDDAPYFGGLKYFYSSGLVHIINFLYLFLIWFLKNS